MRDVNLNKIEKLEKYKTQKILYEIIKALIGDM